MSRILGKMALMAAMAAVTGIEFNSFLDAKVSTSKEKRNEASKETQDKLISAAEAKRKRKEEKLKKQFQS